MSINYEHISRAHAATTPSQTASLGEWAKYLCGRSSLKAAKVFSFILAHLVSKRVLSLSLVNFGGGHTGKSKNCQSKSRVDAKKNFHFSKISPYFCPFCGFATIYSRCISRVSCAKSLVSLRLHSFWAENWIFIGDMPLDIVSRHVTIKVACYM